MTPRPIAELKRDARAKADRLLELEEKATPGPWISDPRAHQRVRTQNDFTIAACGWRTGESEDGANAVLIVGARNSIRPLAEMARGMCGKCTACAGRGHITFLKGNSDGSNMTSPCRSCEQLRPLLERFVEGGE